MGKITVASYLFKRLQQNGVHAVHGVPGDFTLKAIDELQSTGLRWIGNCNELNAGYAADGYARIRGLGALFTTYGVGELSAINAVAGAFSEYVPLVHIVGTASRQLQKEDRQIHHSLGAGRSSNIFAHTARAVTVAQVDLNDNNHAPRLIDETITKCLQTCRPVYIQLPSDMGREQTSDIKLSKPLDTGMKKNVHNEDMAVKLLLQKLHTAKQPLILVDRSMGMQEFRGEINELVRVTGIPTLTLPSGAGMVDHSLPNYYGVHAGPVGQINTMPFMEHCDFVLAFGPMFSDTQTLGWSVVPKRTRTIVIGKGTFGKFPVDTKTVLRRVLEDLDVSKITRSDTSLLGNFRTISVLSADPNSPIDQSSLYLRLNTFFRSNDIILLGNATPILGGRDFVLPPGARVIASGMAFSIGHMLPAAQGAALAQETRPADSRGRTILFMGDGGFQVTAQELSTIIWQRLNVTIFIINNGGYAYERHIHGMDASYNDIAPWDYLQAPKLFGAPGGYQIQTHRIKTWGDLDSLLADKNFCDGQGLKLVDVVVGKYDVPEKFKTVFQNAGANL